MSPPVGVLSAEHAASVLQRTADDPVQPSDVMARSHEELRSCGFSGMKASLLVKNINTS